jgi:two-component system alkaline phosphatase synthesis response regulator PhoP
VFVLDDDTSLREGIASLLHAHGYLVYTFSNPDDAETSAKMLHPRVIVSDMQMPGFRTGVEFMRDLQRVPEMLDIEFIFVTGSDSISESDTDSYPVIRKPFRVDKLLAQLSTRFHR